MKYRKRPIIIDAVLFDGTEGAIMEVKQLAGNNKVLINCDNLVIPTLEGDMIASKGDYIIRGVNGEIYPCKPDIFDKTYDEAG